MSKYKIRFNLGRGENYLKWKITSPNGDVNNYEPTEVCLHMENCKLVNQKGSAQKIFDGANKTVCAWIESETVTIFEPLKDTLNLIPKNAFFAIFSPTYAI